MASHGQKNVASFGPGNASDLATNGAELHQPRGGSGLLPLEGRNVWLEFT